MWAGLEVAVYVHDKAHSVAVVGTSKVALQQVFGSQIGAVIAQVASLTVLSTSCVHIAQVE